jgi:hypothetical protein
VPGGDRRGGCGTHEDARPCAITCRLPARARHGSPESNEIAIGTGMHTGDSGLSFAPDGPADRQHEAPTPDARMVARGRVLVDWRWGW